MHSKVNGKLEKIFRLWPRMPDAKALSINNIYN
jgi:hypothetical protein